MNHLAVSLGAQRKEADMVLRGPYVKAQVVHDLSHSS